MLITNIQGPVVDSRAKTHCVTFCSSPNQSKPSREEATKIPSVAPTATFPIISQ